MRLKNHLKNPNKILKLYQNNAVGIFNFLSSKKMKLESNQTTVHAAQFINHLSRLKKYAEIGASNNALAHF